MLNAMAGFASNIKVSSQCLTLGSILLFFWIPASRAGMTKAANFSCK
ncbi:hypothetical protein [Wolbachia endosymbiont (group A) of Epistrophe grossularia]|nr:hypothetical protein [Wolbachia endosymbiont (group A) of Epistrophe grossularia]